MTAIRGRIVTPEEVLDGCVMIEHGRIAEVGSPQPGVSPDHDFGQALLVPGFIDVHMHGLGRSGVFAVNELVETARMEVEFGTTGFLPTVASLTEDRYLEFGRNVREAQRTAAPRSARILGAHFEGPFINPAGKGGMDEAYLRPVDLDECRRYLNECGDVLRLMTLSPELDGGVELVRLLRTHGVVASLGHSRARPHDLQEAVRAGLTHVCHLFNTFERTELGEGWQWKPGLLEWILINGQLNCEVICDMVHVLPEFVQLAARLLGPDRFLAITDSLPGAGLPPDKYVMADGREFSTETGVARLTSNNAVVGSVLTMNRALGNLVERCGFELVDAARFTSTNPARALGMADERGGIEVGKRADLAVLDADFRCVATFIEGRMVHGD